jgi:glycosyltransferase involved in cell wall biosynthesis
MSDSQPHISVITPVHNGEQHLPQLIHTFLAQNYPLEKWEVIIVDNASTDRTPSIIHNAKKSLIRTVYEAQPGSYAARNTGAKAATGEVFAFTDVDCRPDANWLRSGVTCMEERQLDVVSGRVNQQSKGTPNLFQIVDHIMYLRQSWYAQQGFGATANLFVRREVFKKLGGFSYRMLSSGDREFCIRATQAGFRFGYCDEAVVSHKTRSNITAIISKEIRLGFGFAQVARLHDSGEGWKLLRQTYLPLEGVRGCMVPFPDGMSRARVLLALSIYAMIRVPCRTYGFIKGITTDLRPS